MDTASKIKQALIEALGVNPNLPLTATVVSIENTTCTVKLVSELVLSDVRLSATISDDEDSYLQIPKLGSEVVLMSQTGKLSGLMVIKIDSLEKLSYKKGGFEFVIDGTTGKLTLKKSGANFGALIPELIDTVSNAVIDTPNGPGAINASTKTQLEALKTKFKLILNDV